MTVVTQIRCLIYLIIAGAVVKTASPKKCSEEVDFVNCDKADSGKTVHEFGLYETFRIQAKPRVFQDCSHIRTESASFRIYDVTNSKFNSISAKVNYIDIKPGMLSSYGLYRIHYILTVSGQTSEGMSSLTVEAECWFEIVQKARSYEISGGSNVQEMPCERPVKLRLLTRNFVMTEIERQYWDGFVAQNGTPGKALKGKFVSDFVIFPDFIPKCDSQTIYKFTVRASMGLFAELDILNKTVIAFRIFTSGGFISISCAFNCKEGDLVNPRKIVSFKVTGSNVQMQVDRLSWSISPDVDLKAGRRQSSADEFSLNENVLTFDTTYTVTVKLEDKQAKRSFKTSGNLITGKCHVSPPEGPVGADFTITCTGFEGPQPLLYELFIKESESDLKYIEGSHVNEFTVVLPDNSAVVRVTDAGGNFHDESITVELIKEKNIDLTIEELKTRISSTTYQNDWKSSLELLSSLSAVLRDNNMMTVENKLEMLRRFDPINEYSDTMIRSGASVVNSINMDDDLDPQDVFMCSGIVLGKLSQNLAQLTEESRLDFKSNNLTWTSLYLLNAVQKTVQLKTVDKSVQDLNAHDTQVHLNKMRKGTSELITGTYNIMKTVAFDNYGEDKERSVTNENVQMVVKINTPENAFQFTSRNVSLKFPQNFGSQFKEFEKLSITQTSVPNLFWWLPNEVNTDNVIASITGYREGRETKLTVSKQPFTVKLEAHKITTDHLTGTANYAPANVKGSARDNYLSVHMLLYDQGKGQLLLLVAGSIRIIVLQDRFPSYEETLKSSVTSNFLSLSLTGANDSVSVRVYVAVLPSQSAIGPVRYNISIRHVVCQIWSDYAFNDRYCKVGSNITWDAIHCECTHFSVFVGKFFVPPNSLHLWKDLSLFATIQDNYYVVILAGGMFTIMLILILFACLFDYRRDQFVPILLEDNYPKDTVPYLLCVESGRDCSRMNTAKVGIKLFGSTNNSKAHVLNHNSKKTLRPGSEDWFLIFCPNPLGDIRSVELWHDDSGKHPNWFCVQVIVVDLNSEKTYTFKFDDWLSLDHRLQDDSRSASKVPLSTSVNEDSKKLLAYHLRMGFREKHRWSRIVTRHPRSKYTKSERITLAFGIAMTTMLTSMMFYGVEYEGPSDFPVVSARLEDYIIGWESTLISSVVLVWVFFCFAKSKKFESKEVTKTIVISQPMPNPDIMWQPAQRKKFVLMASRLYNLVVRKMMMSMMPDDINPVTISKTVAQTKWRWLVTAWILSMTVNATTTFFVVWYGLKFGKKKSLNWMISFFLGIFNDIGILQTLKVIAVAVLMAYVFRGTGKDSVRVGMVKNLPEPETYNERIDFLKKYCSLRTSPAYKPLYPDYAKKTISERRKRNILKKNIFSFTLAFSFVLPVAIYLQSLFLKNEFFATHSFMEAIAEPAMLHTKDFFHIQNKTELLEFVVWSLLPVFHNSRWYNGKPFPLEVSETEEDLQSNHSESLVRGYLKDGATKVLGVARIYQQRIKPESFQPVPEQFQAWFYNAHGSIHYYNEDARSYGKFWIRHAEAYDYLNVWKYKNWETSDTYLLFSETIAPYFGGGYMVHLHSTKGGSIGVLTDLYMNDWINNLTRLIVLEINLYTMNTNRYRSVRLIFETLPSGQMSKRVQVETLYMISKEQGVKQFICLGIIIILTLILIPICYMQYSPIGLILYLKSLSNINEILILISSLVFLISFLLKYFTFLTYEEVQTNSRDEYVSVTRLIHAQIAASIAFGLFSLLVFLRTGYAFFKIVNVHRIIRNFIKVCALALLPGFVAASYAIHVRYVADIVHSLPVTLTLLPHLRTLYLGKDESQSAFLVSPSLVALAMNIVSSGILVHECHESERLHDLKVRPVLKIQRVMIQSNRKVMEAVEPMVLKRRGRLNE